VKLRDGSYAGHRFYGFGKSGDRLVAASQGAGGAHTNWYTNIDGTWVERTGNTADLLNIYGPPFWHADGSFSTYAGGDTFVLEADGSTLTKKKELAVGQGAIGSWGVGNRYYMVGSHVFRNDEDKPILTNLSGPVQWSNACETPSGDLWISAYDIWGGGGTRIYRVPAHLLHLEYMEE
jgi:hypothetical protein